MTKQLNFSVKNYGDLFNIWSTDPFFRAKYPYLPDLRRYALGLIKQLPRGNLNKNIYNYVCGGYLDWDCPVVLDLMHTYIVKKYMNMNDGVICIDKDTEYLSIIYCITRKYNYKIRICDIGGLQHCEVSFGSRIVKEMFDNNMLSISKMDGSLIECDNDVDYSCKLLYDMTHNPAYKPSAYAVLQCFKPNYSICKYVIPQIEYIKENDCIWTVHDDMNYNLLRENCETLYKDKSIKSVDHIICRQADGKWLQRYATYHLVDIIGYAKKYNWDVNALVTNGSYLVHYAAQQHDMTCMKELLDMGAKLLDEEGFLLLGEERKSIYGFSLNKSGLDGFLHEYYKDDTIMYEKVRYKEMNGVTKNIDPDNITIEIEWDEYEEIDWSSIPDTNIRQDMQAEYFKLYLQKRDIKL